MKTRTAIAIILLILSPLGAKAGASSMGIKEGGGGDPLVVEFLQIARQILSVLPPQGEAANSMNQKTFSEAIKKVELSVEGFSPILFFPEGKTVSCYGVPKAGCVGVDGKITIARDGWTSADQLSKIELTVMEMSILAGSRNSRYEMAPDLASRVLSQGFRPAAFNSSNSTSSDDVLLTPQEASVIFQSINESIERQQKAFNCSHEYPTGQKVQIRGELHLALQPAMRVYRSRARGQLLKIDRFSGAWASTLLISTDGQRKSITGYIQYSYEWQAGSTKNVGTLDEPRYVSTPAGLQLSFSDKCLDHD